MSNSKRSDWLPANVWFLPDAEQDFLALDRGQQILVLKALQKIARAPGDVGKALGNQQERHLSGFRSIYVNRKQIRIVWKVAEDGRVQVVVVAAVLEREGMHVYSVAARRRPAIDEWLKRQLKAQDGSPRE